MIANLITTILLALGVATGNVSSNSYKGGNAFNHEEKKPIQKAVETEITNATFYLASELDVTLTGRHEELRKYYIKKPEEQTQNAIYETDIYNIYNSTYELIFDDATNQTENLLVSIMAITTYFNFISEQISLTQDIYIINHRGANQDIDMALISYEDVSQITQYIDLTLTNSLAQNIFNDLVLTYASKVRPQRTTEHLATGSYVSTTKTHTYTLEDLRPNETRYVVMITQVQQYGGGGTSTNNADLTPIAISFRGTWTETEINYEVVDIPNLMFTILTLPFSFYSTAFNLTIFPNTPYALNFGNLILTIVAALILLYIIKKVLK